MPFADVTRIEDHKIGALGRLRLGKTDGGQQLRHARGVINVHLAAVSRDEEPFGHVLHTR